MWQIAQSKKMINFRLGDDETPIRDSLYDYAKRQTIFVMIYYDDWRKKNRKRPRKKRTEQQQQRKQEHAISDAAVATLRRHT